MKESLPYFRCIVITKIKRKSWRISRKPWLASSNKIQTVFRAIQGGFNRLNPVETKLKQPETQNQIPENLRDAKVKHGKPRWREIIFRPDDCLLLYFHQL